jgi:hypothetical protein
LAGSIPQSYADAYSSGGTSGGSMAATEDKVDEEKKRGLSMKIDTRGTLN